MQSNSSRYSHLSELLLESPPPGAVELKLHGYTLVAVLARVQSSATHPRELATMSTGELLTLCFSALDITRLLGGGSVRVALGNAWVCGGADDGSRLTIGLTLSCDPGQKSANLPR